MRLHSIQRRFRWWVLLFLDAISDDVMHCDMTWCLFPVLYPVPHLSSIHLQRSPSLSVFYLPSLFPIICSFILFYVTICSGSFSLLNIDSYLSFLSLPVSTSSVDLNAFLSDFVTVLLLSYQTSNLSFFLDSYPTLYPPYTNTKAMRWTCTCPRRRKRKLRQRSSCASHTI